jgi:hypothetical protein
MKKYTFEVCSHYFINILADIQEEAEQSARIELSKRFNRPFPEYRKLILLDERELQ